MTMISSNLISEKDTSEMALAWILYQSGSALWQLTLKPPEFRAVVQLIYRKEKTKCPEPTIFG